MTFSQNDDNINDSQQVSRKQGSIKAIRLENFMCHEHFELKLGPRVNFIIGPNGSGKSALLTALVVGLGGRATITSRARKNSEFVMYGKRQARISVTIHNYDKIMDKERAFKPDEYGKSIIIEKIIQKDDSGSRLIIKNHRGQKVSERKQELDDLIEHFGILINNPICILNQEVSKTFLHSKRGEDKYDLFMKATNLEQIEKDYNRANDSHKEWVDCNNRSTSAFKLLDNEYNRCLEQTEDLKSRTKLNDKKAELNVELYWAHLLEDENDCQEMHGKIAELKKKISDCEDETQSRHEKLKSYTEDIAAMQVKIDSVNERVDYTRSKIKEIQAKTSESNKDRIEKESEVRNCEKEISRLVKDRTDLETSIKDVKRQLEEQHILDQESERRKTKIERLEKEIETSKAREKGLRNEVMHLNSSMIQVRTEISQTNHTISDLKSKLFRCESDHRRVINGQQNALRKFGEFSVKANEEINKAWAQKRFIKKPIGPLGHYIKLSTEDISKPLEIHLGKNAFAFVCDNLRDMATLSAIFRKIETTTNDVRQPLIIARAFGNRHDVKRFRASHDRFKTFLDYLDIENDAVYNALVDRCSLESVLFIPDYNEAENLLINYSLVPKNTRSAYTKDCYLMYPVDSNGGYRSYANDARRCSLFSENNSLILQNLERDIRNFKKEIEMATQEAQRLQKAYDSQRKLYEECNNEIKKIVESLRNYDQELIELRYVLPSHEPSELKGLEEDLETTIKSIELKKLDLDKLKSELQAIKDSLAEHEAEMKECTEILKNHDQNRSAVHKQIENTKENIRIAKERINQLANVIESRQKNLSKTETDVKSCTETLETRKQRAPGNRPRGTIRDKETIQKDLQRLEQNIRRFEEDGRDPEEVIKILAKRMTEIKEMTKLKNYNLNNAERSSKTLSERAAGFQNLRKTTISNVATTFSNVMRSMDMTGAMVIYVDPLVEQGEVIKKGKTLEIRVDTKESQSTSNRLTDARSLSGGERSFSTVAFVLSLWQHCASPFKLMDEVDVFMDMVTRRVSYNALIRFAQLAEDPGQFIFFSPLELPKFDMDFSDIHVFEMPAIIRNDERPVPGRKRPFSASQH